MSGKAVIAFVFPEPEDNLTMARIISMCKEPFKDIPDVKIHMAIKDAADTIEFFVENGELPTDISDLDEDGGLVRHARRELELAGNEKRFNNTIINAIREFSKYGHSGGSASVAIH